MKKNLARLAAAAAVLLALKAQFGQGPRWQDGLVEVLSSGLCLAALLAFIELEAWPAFSSFLATLLLYDLYVAIKPPLPGSLVTMYMAITVLGVAVYFTVAEKNMMGLVQGVAGLFSEPRALWHRRAVLAFLPLWCSAVVLARSFPELTPPVRLRIVHPEPPTEIQAYGRGFDMLRGTNPYRRLKSQDPQKFGAYVADGKKIYYQNCFYCHGDDLAGKGHYAHGFNPKPANFRDIGTIAMLQESYVFWRVAKGGPGLPGSSHPWDSAMPVWEDMLSEDQIWKVILYVYDRAGYEPRTFAAEGESGGHEHGKEEAGAGESE